MKKIAFILTVFFGVFLILIIGADTQVINSIDTTVETHNDKIYNSTLITENTDTNEDLHIDFSILKEFNPDNYDWSGVVSQCSFAGDEVCSVVNNYPIPTCSYEPKLWAVNYNDSTNTISDELKIEHLKHIHTANYNNENVWFLTGISFDDKFYMIKILNGQIVSEFKLESLPYETFIFEDTIIVSYKENNNTFKLYKVNFLSESLDFITDCYYDCFIGENSLNSTNAVFTFNDKLFYKVAANKWSLYSKNVVDSFEMKGYCAGFLNENEVVFYQKSTDTPLYSLTDDSFFEIGKIVILDLDSKKESESKLLKMPSEVYDNLFLSNDSKYLFAEYGSIDNNHNGLIINLSDYSVEKIYWYPESYRRVQSMGTQGTVSVKT